MWQQQLFHFGTPNGEVPSGAGGQHSPLGTSRDHMTSSERDGKQFPGQDQSFSVAELYNIFSINRT